MESRKYPPPKNNPENPQGDVRHEEDDVFYDDDSEIPQDPGSGQGIRLTLTTVSLEH